MENRQNYNQVTLRGTVLTSPEPSHENHGELFYRFTLQIPRLSGQEDLLTVLAGERVLSAHFPREREPLAVFGQLRSFNNRSVQGRRLVISVFARQLAATEEEPLNQICLCGTLCKKPVLRRTPLGRSICDLLLAVNRRYGRADYLPCIAWGQVALETGELDVGEPLALEGRVQSRIYSKVLEDRVEERTAYEVSIMRLLEADALLSGGEAGNFRE